jgi:hypothetical protein
MTKNENLKLALIILTIIAIYIFAMSAISGPNPNNPGSGQSTIAKPVNYGNGVFAFTTTGRHLQGSIR